MSSCLDHFSHVFYLAVTLTVSFTRLMECVLLQSANQIEGKVHCCFNLVDSLDCNTEVIRQQVCYYIFVFHTVLMITVLLGI